MSRASESNNVMIARMAANDPEMNATNLGYKCMRTTEQLFPQDNIDRLTERQVQFFPLGIDQGICLQLDVNYSISFGIDGVIH